MLAGAECVYSVSTLGRDALILVPLRSRRRCSTQDDMGRRFRGSLAPPLASVFYYARHGICRVLRRYKADAKASGLIESKEGYVLNIIGIFKQYWGYFERLSWWQHRQIPLPLHPASLEALARASAANFSFTA